MPLGQYLYLWAQGYVGDRDVTYSFHQQFREAPVDLWGNKQYAGSLLGSKTSLEPGSVSKTNFRSTGLMARAITGK